MNDCVGGKNLAGTSYANDRIGLTNDTFQLGNNVYATADSTGIYFSSAFTITLWTKAAPCLSAWCKLLDFGSGQASNNVYLALEGATGVTGTGLTVGMYDGAGSIRSQYGTNYILTAGTWKFVAVTYDGYTTTIYVDGVSIGSSTSSTYWVPPSVTRSLSYIGKSNWVSDGYSNSSMVDQIAIYNRELTSAQISSLFSISYTPTGAN